MSETQTQDAPAEDIRSMLGAAFDEQAEPAEAPKPAQDAPGADDAPAAQRARDERGRFAEAAKDAAEAAPPIADATPATEAAPAADAPPAPDAEFNKATAMWSAADREMAGKLPKEARDFLARRHRDMDADYTRKMQPLAEMRQKYEPIDQMFAPHEQTMRQKGLTVPGMIQAWANVEQRLIDPGAAPAMVAQIMRGYNVDPRHVLHTLGIPLPDGVAPAPQPQQPTIPPEVSRELQEMKRFMASQQQMQLASEETRLANEIHSFASATDSAGALLHPHFADVEAHMAQLAKLEMDQGGKPELSKLYETAVWMNTSTRDRMLADQRAASQAQQAAAQKVRDQEARAKAGQARRASSSVTGSPGPARPNAAGNGSVRSVLEDAFDQLAT